jgi:hypothetical protein
MPVKKPMVCIDCHDRIDATIAQAKAHGWNLWVGGARCKACVERGAVVAEIQKSPPSPTALVCGRCGHTERWHRPDRCEGYMDSAPGGSPRCACSGFLHPFAEVTP